MKLKTTSLSTKLYLWFYGLDVDQLPSNLCPYFWKLVLMYILLIPYSIFCLPVILTEIGLKIIKKESSDNTTGERMGYSIAMYIILFGVSSLIVSFTLLWNTYSQKTNPFLYNLSIGGTFLWFIGLVTGIYHGLKYMINSIRDWNYNRTIKYDENGYRIYREPKVNIVKEFVKAKYHKYCPKIDWVTNKK